ncbi:MAG: lipoyl domain-containing protein [Spirochaetota bacterium]
MAHVVTMPRQGNTVESCVLVGWHAKEGAKVAAGDVLCDVETDKAVFEGHNIPVTQGFSQPSVVEPE